MLQHIDIILMEPVYPGNIGAAARAMKTMGLSRLTLVAPEIFPSPLASAKASHAHDILENARVCRTLDEALADKTLIFATTGREHDLNMRHLSAHEAAQFIHENSATPNNMAIIFGRESIGLKNEEVLKSHYQVHIPTHPDYGSLNLSQAVQILCYELWQTQNQPLPNSKALPDLASALSIENFYQHLDALLIHIGFLRTHNEKLSDKLRALFWRAQMSESDVNILRGILTETQKRLKAHD